MKKNKYYGKLNKCRPRRKIKAVCFVFLSLFLAIFYVIYFSSFFQIKKIEISGNQKVSSQELISDIEEKLTKKILFFNSKSLFLAEPEEIENIILKKYPIIEKTDFLKKLPDKLEVLIKERSPVAVFEKDNEYFFIDESGIVFEKIESRRDFLLIKKTESDEKINLGENIIKKEQVSQILKADLEIKDKTPKVDIDFAQIVNEQRFNIKTLEGFEIFFDFSKDIPQQVLNLSVVLKEKISPQARRNLEYIDLRFGNQIYYK